MYTLVNPGSQGPGPPPPNVGRNFLFCKNKFHDKLAYFSGCDNAKKAFSFRGIRPREPLTRALPLDPTGGSALRPPDFRHRYVAL